MLVHNEIKIMLLNSFHQITCLFPFRTLGIYFEFWLLFVRLKEQVDGSE